jgi:hypothetical protein
MIVCWECCVLSGRGLCDGLITRPEESYRLWRVVACDQETSKMRRQKPATGLWKIQPQWVVTPGKQTNKQTCSTEQCFVREFYFSLTLNLWTRLVYSSLKAVSLFSNQISRCFYSVLLMGSFQLQICPRTRAYVPIISNQASACLCRQRE